MSAISQIDPIAMSQTEAALARCDFRVFCELALEQRGQTPAAHHVLLIEKLQAIADGALRKLFVAMPPGSAKSTYCSQLFAAWWLARSIARTRRCVISVSHTASMAETNSRRAQQFVRENAAILGYSLDRESVEDWSTTTQGEYKAAGVGGPITGRRAGLALIDDPVKNAEQVASEDTRNKMWDWYVTTFRTRLIPDAPQIIVMTRWHEDDLGGRVLATESDWEKLILPAEAVADDPLGRAPGAWLWDDDSWNFAKLAQEQKRLAQAGGTTRHYNALYQQDPRPAEGLLFTGPMPLWSEAVPAGQRVRSWDLAATDGGGDWTAGVLMRRTACSRYVVEDVKRVQLPPEGVEALIMRTAAEDGKSVTIRLPEDPGQAGKSQSLYFTRRLEGYRVECVRETGDKATRATPLASQCNVGNLFLIEAPWNRAFREEMRGFPAAAHDDQVDAASGAFAVLTAKPKPIRVHTDAVRAAPIRRLG